MSDPRTLDTGAAKMTPLEMAKLCASAMGYLTDPTADIEWKDLRELVGSTWCGIYNPSDNNSQAFLLVKKLKLDIEAPDDDGMWGVSYGDDTAWLGALCHCRHKDLNRAIVECVATMEKSKHERR